MYRCSIDSVTHTAMDTLLIFLIHLNIDAFSNSRTLLINTNISMILIFQKFGFRNKKKISSLKGFS